MKAEIDSSDSAWRYAAEMENPHPIASIRVALRNGDFPSALKVDSFIAANSQALESVATALSFAVTYFAVHGLNGISSIYRSELNEVMAIELGHFNDLKKTIEKIANVYKLIIDVEKQVNDENYEIEKGDSDCEAENDSYSQLMKIFESDSPPLDRPKLFRIHWIARRDNPVDVDQKLLQLCAECGDVKLFNEVKEKLKEKFGIVDENIECQDVVSDSLDVVSFLSSFPRISE